MSGYKISVVKEFWEESVGMNINPDDLPRYSQFETCRMGDIVLYNSIAYRCLNDTSKLHLIPHRLADDKQPVTDWQLSTFHTNYASYKSPWLT